MRICLASLNLLCNEFQREETRNGDLIKCAIYKLFTVLFQRFEYWKYQYSFRFWNNGFIAETSVFPSGKSLPDCEILRKLKIYWLYNMSVRLVWSSLHCAFRMCGAPLIQRGTAGPDPWAVGLRKSAFLLVCRNIYKFQNTISTNLQSNAFLYVSIAVYRVGLPLKVLWTV